MPKQDSYVTMSSNEGSNSLVERLSNYIYNYLAAARATKEDPNSSPTFLPTICVYFNCQPPPFHHRHIAAAISPAARASSGAPAGGGNAAVGAAVAIALLPLNPLPHFSSSCFNAVWPWHKQLQPLDGDVVTWG